MSQRRSRDGADARRCLEAVEASGMALGAWANAHGVDGRSLRAWGMNLARRAPRQPPPGRAAALVELVPQVAVDVRPQYRILCGGMAVEVAPPAARGGGNMLTLPRHVRVFVATEPFNMRGSFDAMAGQVRRLGLEPVDGNLYVFLSRRRALAAVLYFDGTGWCAFRKRVETGTFQLPHIPPGRDRVAVDGRVLAAMLEGIDLRAPRRRWYEPHAVPQS